MKNSNNDRPDSPQVIKSNRQLRKDLRKKDFHVYVFSFRAKCAARILSRQYKEVFWVFAEEFGFMVLNLNDAERINKARQKHGITKLRIRDINKMSIYRFPKKAWGF